MEYLFTLCRRCIIMTDLIKSFSGYAEETGRISRERERKRRNLGHGLCEGCLETLKKLEIQYRAKVTESCDRT